MATPVGNRPLDLAHGSHPNVIFSVVILHHLVLSNQHLWISIHQFYLFGKLFCMWAKRLLLTYITVVTWRFKIVTRWQVRVYLCELAILWRYSTVMWRSLSYITCRNYSALHPICIASLMFTLTEPLALLTSASSNFFQFALVSIHHTDLSPTMLRPICTSG